MPTFELFTAATQSPKMEKELHIVTDYRSAVLYLAPHTSAGRGNLCPSASEECAAACLGLYSGRADIIKAGEETNPVREARKRRAQMFFDLGADAFGGILSRDLYKHVTHCHEIGKLPAARLNGSSDVMWERATPAVFDDFGGVQFYDYSKVPPRKRANLPTNYHLTQSYSGHNVRDCLDALEMGRNVAVVFRLKPSQAFPSSMRFGGVEVPVIDGDQHDQRFRDPSPCIVGLRAKGRLRSRPSAFTVVAGEAVTA